MISTNDIIKYYITKIQKNQATGIGYVPKDLHTMKLNPRMEKY